MRIDESLGRTRDYLLSNQRPDGTWSGVIASDPRATAFYLNTVRNLGRESNNITREMEIYLSSEQQPCGAWQAWPEGGSNLDVTAVCALALEKPETEQGRLARFRAQRWLSKQPHPDVDSFWLGYLALSGELNWEDVPYLTPRLVTNPSWLHPNIYDFSFVRIAVAAASLLQTHEAESGSDANANPIQSANTEQLPEFAEWKLWWITNARRPIRGVLPMMCAIVRSFDRIAPIRKHRRKALDWLLEHQEDDGSFFASVHMTSIAILTLHRLDSLKYRDRIEAGLSAMEKWQVVDERGRRQAFTDGTTWDTIICTDALRRLGVALTDPHIRRARDFVLSNQTQCLGDWSHRVHKPKAGGWGFQRTGQWYPDSDDTIMAISALLQLENSSSCPHVRRGIEWILAMQCSNGGWASWDRNDRAWIKFPLAGPWFARDVPCTEITARILILLSQIVRGEHLYLVDLVPAARKAINKGMKWLKRHNQDGLWFGGWFTHYLYGTCHAIEAYREMGYSPIAPEIEAAVNKVISLANPDGGFGEAPTSGLDNGFVTATSTPFHTACALLALVHGGAYNHPSAERAATWLLDNQNTDGGWTNKDFFAAGVPGLWYANFELTPTYFVVKALHLYGQNWPSSEIENVSR